MPWYAPILRAVPAIVFAAVITFSLDHSAPLGFVSFGIVGIPSAAVLAYAALRATGVERTMGLVHAVLTLIAAALALLSTQAGLPLLVLLVSGWAVVTGFVELYLGLRSRRRDRFGRDRIFSGALTVALGLALLLVPPQYSQPLGGIENVQGTLTASVIVVGAMGAYWAVLGVFLVIAGLSLKWAPDAAKKEVPA